MERMRAESPEPRSGGEGGGGNGSVATMAPPSAPAVARPVVPSSAVSVGPSNAIRPRKPVPKPLKLAKAIAVCSGKGGVGKSNLAVNLAACMSALGLKVCLLDADLGMANADVLCNLSPRLTLEHVVTGRCRLSEAMLLAPGGFRLIPGASGVAGMADLDSVRRAGILQQLSVLEQVADVILIDCGAGISSNVLAFAASAHHVLVITNAEPTAMMDGYGMIKALVGHAPSVCLEVIVNMAASEQEARSVFARISRVSQSFLSRSLGYGGAIPADPAVRDAVRHRIPFTLLSPQAPATLALHALARRLAGLDDTAATAALSDRSNGFFARISRFFKPSNASRSARSTD